MNTSTTVSIDNIIKRLENHKILYIFYNAVYLYSKDDEEYHQDQVFSSSFKAQKYVANNYAHLVLTEYEKFAKKYKETDEENYIRTTREIESLQQLEDERLEAEAQR